MRYNLDKLKHFHSKQKKKKATSFPFIYLLFFMQINLRISSERNTKKCMKLYYLTKNIVNNQQLFGDNKNFPDNHLSLGRYL